MINEARRNAVNKALADRTTYHLGDYVDLASELDASDVTIMDKVVCCYPDPERLLKAVLPNTRRVIALTYPRDRTFTRVSIAAFALLLRTLRSDFRPYVHNPEDIRRLITDEGFSLKSLNRVFAWQTEVYVRA
jgi:magnesium-protoporphyrin O-methyltransferase